MECYLCQSSSHKKREGSVRDNNTLEILECNNCGLVFLSSLEHIDEGYYEDSTMSDGLNIEEWLHETKSDDVRRFEFVKEMIVNKNLADFGSGAGGFLSIAKNLASSIIGIELDKKIIKHYEDNNIEHSSSIENLEDEKYDVITAFHVVEHLANPIDILQKLVKKLKKGGKLIVEVPNSDDALLNIYQNTAFSNFTYWGPHLYLYNSKTLELMLSKIANLDKGFIKYIQRYPLSNHLYWLAKNKPGGHQEWGSFLDSPLLMNAYESQLASIGATDTLISIYTKK